MRFTFIKTLLEIASKDKDVFLLTGDLGYNMIEPFVAALPKQFLNVGVAEQNMIGLAAGMALAGKKVFVYSISTFATLRPFEQIRNDVCYQNLPVFIIGGGTAFSYSLLGCTHFPIEDLGVMSVLPNMAVFSPGDPFEVEALTIAAYKRSGPAYIRLGRRGEPIVHKKINEIKMGKMSVLTRGSDATVIVSGRLLPQALAAANQLKKTDNLSIRVVSAHTLKPFDTTFIKSCIKETKAIITVEEHLMSCGLASAVAGVLARESARVPFVSLGIPDEFPKGVGWQDYFFKRYHLTAEGIAAAVKKCLIKRK